MNRFVLLKNLNALVAETSSKNQLSQSWLYMDYLMSYIKWGYSLRDYFSYELYFRNRRGKREFISSREMINWYKRNNDKSQQELIDNKESCLDFFSDFISREWCGQNYNNSKECFSHFVQKHNKCIVKPLNGSGGHGVHFVEIQQLGGLYEYCKKGCYLIEEIIIQHEAISKLYPHSINTIRFFTFYGNIIGAVIRMGRRGAMIDNASSGGIYAELDIESGRIISPAYTFQNQMYQKHPDTNVFFMGFEIPLWDSCTELIAKACERLKVYL